MAVYAYASLPDVLGHLPFMPGATFTATSRPNATQVHGYLLDTAQDLETALAGRDYTAPVATTATGAFAQMNSWNAVGAAMHAAAAMPAGGDGKHLAFLERRWDAILKSIRDGDATLPDAGRETSTSRPRYGGAATPRFNRDFDGYGV